MGRDFLPVLVVAGACSLACHSRDHDAAVGTAPVEDGSAPVDAATAGEDAAALVDASDAEADDSSSPTDAGLWWQPAVASTWDWQLRVPIDPSVNVDVYDIDLFENAPAVFADLHARGRKVICYVNLGAWEAWRPDAAQFPASVIGAQYHGFPDENWLDIRQIALLAPIVGARLDLAQAKGCDAVEPDNMDGYNVSAHEATGFPLTYQDQVAYNRFVASEAHARGLAVGLKNDTAQVVDLVNDFDFSVSEQCFQFNECQHLLPFINAGKPVFEAEYELMTAQYCAAAAQLSISAIKKMVDLGVWHESCP